MREGPALSPPGAGVTGSSQGQQGFAVPAPGPCGAGAAGRGWGGERGEDRDPTRQTLGVRSLPAGCQGKFLINGV